MADPSNVDPSVYNVSFSLIKILEEIGTNVETILNRMGLVNSTLIEDAEHVLFVNAHGLSTLRLFYYTANRLPNLFERLQSNRRLYQKLNTTFCYIELQNLYKLFIQSIGTNLMIIAVHSFTPQRLRIEAIDLFRALVNNLDTIILLSTEVDNIMLDEDFIERLSLPVQSTEQLFQLVQNLRSRFNASVSGILQ